MAEQILYVVFHGLIPLIEDNDKFHAILIRMDDHRVAVGHWLTEISLPYRPGTIWELQGLDPGGQGGLSADQNLIVTRDVDLDGISRSADCYARIDLCKPRKCYSYFIGDAAPFLTGSDQPTLKNYAGVQVFEYAVPGNDFTKVVLSPGGEPWKVGGYALMANNDKISVMHIYNEPEGRKDKILSSHSREEFLKGSALFGLDLGLVGNDKTCLPFPQTTATTQTMLPSGLLLGELAPLSCRDVQVFDILDPLRVNPRRVGGLPGPGKPIAGGHYCGWINIASPR